MNPYINIQPNNRPVQLLITDLDGTATDFDPIEQDLCLRLGFIPFMQEHRNKGVLIALYTNTHPNHIDSVLQENGLSKVLFNGGIFCSSGKNGPKQFDRVLKHNKITSKRAIVLGNNPYEDILGAQLLGIGYIHLRDYFTQTGHQIKSFWDLKGLF